MKLTTPHREFPTAKYTGKKKKKKKKKKKIQIHKLKTKKTK
jgi:hypothetical protein